MNIEPKQPTRKAPADWFTGDGATWLEHVTDEQYKAAAATVSS